MKQIIVINLLVMLVIGCSSPQALEPETVEPQAFVAVASNAKQEGLRIVSIDGNPVQETDGSYLNPGPHQFSAMCRLQNGVGASFSFEVDLAPNASYCFFSDNGANSCRILYTKVDWSNNKVVICN